MPTFTPQEALHLAMNTNVPVQYSADNIHWIDLTKDNLMVMGIISFMEGTPYTFRANPNYIVLGDLIAKKPSYDLVPVNTEIWYVDGDNIAGIGQMHVSHPNILCNSALGYFKTKKDLEAFVAVASHIAKHGLYLREPSHA